MTFSVFQGEMAQAFLIKTTGLAWKLVAVFIPSVGEITGLIAPLKHRVRSLSPCKQVSGIATPLPAVFLQILMSCQLARYALSHSVDTSRFPRRGPCTRACLRGPLPTTKDNPCSIRS